MILKQILIISSSLSDMEICAGQCDHIHLHLKVRII
jgi:hypothetical protein